MIYILDTAPLLGSSFANVFSFITYIKVSWLAKMSNLMRSFNRLLFNLLLCVSSCLLFCL